jgi:hypothetical protein
MGGLSAVHRVRSSGAAVPPQFQKVRSHCSQFFRHFLKSRGKPKNEKTGKHGAGAKRHACVDVTLWSGSLQRGTIFSTREKKTNLL